MLLTPPSTPTAGDWIPKDSAPHPRSTFFANLQRLYGKPSYQELNAALLRIGKQMKLIQLVEVMLRGIE